MAKSKHYGAFAKGFADSMLAAMKLRMTMDLYQARADYYRDRGYAATHPQGKGIYGAGIQGAIAEGEAGYGQGGGGGGGGGPVNQTLAANQAEAYNAARAEGLSDSSARALVANFSGEGLAVPGDKHLDPNGRQNAFGIAQWDDARAAAIQKQFGKMPNEMSVADQTKAAIWELRTNPRFKETWDALNNDNASPESKVRTLVSNYEQPKDVPTSTSQRLSFLGRLPTTFQGEGGTTVATTGRRDTTGLAADKSTAPLDSPALSDKKPEAVAAVNSALDNAKSMLGKNEVPNHDEVMAYLHDGGQDLDPHKSAWCAAFVSASLKKAGLPVPTVVRPGTETGPGNVAGDYRTWGSAVDPKNIQPGDVLVANDGSHVGFAEGPIRQGKNGPEVKLIAGNETDKSGRYKPGSYTMQTGRVIGRSQVGQVGERWVPLSSYSARRAEPGTTADGRTAEVSPSATDEQKVAAAKQVTTPFQVAGEVPTGMTEAGAERARKTLEEHRVPANAPKDMSSMSLEELKNLPNAPAGYDPRLSEARRDADLRGDRTLPEPEQPALPHVLRPDEQPAIPRTPTPPSGYPTPPERQLGADAIVKAGLNAPGYRPSQYDRPVDQPITRTPIGGGAGNVMEGRPQPVPIGGGAGNVLEAPTPPSEPVGTNFVRPTGSPMGPSQQPRSIATTNLSEAATPYEPPASLTGQSEHMPPQQNVKGQQAVGAIPRSASEPDKPAPASQPVSATRPAPAAPARTALGDAPGTIQYHVPESSASRAPIYTVADLSHLWGPNPPVSERAPAPPSAPPPPPPSHVRDDQDFAVGAPDVSNVELGSQIMGSAKGGPINPVGKFAKGGGIPSRPTMKLADAGPVSSQYPTYTPAAPTPGPGLQGNVRAATQYMMSLPGMSPIDLDNSTRGYYTNYGPNSFQGQGGADILADYGRMSPDQVNQYNQMIAGTWKPPAPAPAAPAPTPAPAPAPAPVVNPPSVQNITTYQGTPTDPSGVTTIDPTSTTTTGVPGVSNKVTPAKTYDPNAIGTTGSGGATAYDNAAGTDYSVDKKGNTDQTILSAKGGAIPSRPTLKFAAAGAVPGMSPGIAYMYSPNYIGPTAGGGWSGATSYDQLAPNQQAWANTTRGLLDQIRQGGQADYGYWSGGGRSMTGPVDTSQYMTQLTAMPDAIWPTKPDTTPKPINQPAPTATTITSPSADLNATVATIDPTSTTTTGTPGVPTTGVQAKTYDPNNIATTGSGSTTDSTGGTNYSTDPKDQTTQILSRKGGPITQRVSRYDDGGGVSPSIAGAPPGATGGQGAVPPIYFNPATYAAAGAPVGKGVSASSAPTYLAGAIPSLPMARGGVVAFDDGGAAGGDDMATIQQMDYEDARMEADQPAPQGPPPTPRDASGMPLTDVNPYDYIQPPAGGQGGGAPQADHNVPPPDQTQPEISDGQGHPSRGLIGAISDGLHWLGDHLGLVGGAQAHPAIATGPETQDARQKFVGNHPDGATYMTHQNMEELKDIADPGHQLNDAYRTIAGLEAGYKFALSHGDDENASRLAASILHYSVLTSQNLSAEAAKSLYRGDMQDAVNKLNQASDALPDGTLTHATLNPDGTVTIQGKNLDGQVEWQKHGAAATILEHATSLGRSGKLQWDQLESQAAKYDHTFADMVKNRNANAGIQRKQDAADAEAARAEEVFKKMYPDRAADKAAPPTTPALPGPPNAPSTITVQNAPAAPAAATTIEGGAPAPTSGGTPPATPPAGADTTAFKPSDLGGEAPTAPPAAPAPAPTYAASDLGGAPALPGPVQLSAPTQETAAATPNVPAANAQDVALWDTGAINTKRVQIRQDIVDKYRDAKTGAWKVEGEPAVPPRPDTIPEYAKLTSQDKVAARNAYIEGLKTHDAWVKDQQNNMNAEIAKADKDYTDDLQSRRIKDTQERSDQKTKEGREFTEGQANKRMDFETKAKALAVKTAEEHAAYNPRPDADVEKMFTLTPDAQGKMTGKTPSDYYKDQAATMPDGTVNPDQKYRDDHYNAEFNDRNQRMNMDNALKNGYRYSHDADPAAIADALRGFVLNDYTATSAPVPINTYPPRYAVVVTRPSDGTMQTVILPKENWANILSMHNAKATLAARNKADTEAAATNPYRPPPPPAGAAPVNRMGWRRGGAIPARPTIDQMQRYG